MKKSEIIENWMFNTIKNGSWKRYNDLHIDEISSMYKKGNAWISGLQYCLKMAIKIRDYRSINFIIGIGLSLQSSDKPIEKSIKSLAELETEIDWTPPSSYLFHPEWEEWREIEKNATIITDFSLGIKCEKKYLLQFYKEDANEYRRSLFIVSKSLIKDLGSN